MNGATFAYLLLGVFAGLVAGTLIGWAIQRRQSLNLSTQIFVEKEISASLRCDIVRAEAELANRDEALTRYQSAIEKVEERFTNAFENLANRILEDRSSKLRDINATALGHLLDPLGRQITDFRQRVDAIHTSDTSDRSALRAQVKELTLLNQQVTAEAKNLATALKGQVKSQGAWGEFILESLLEKSGLTRNSEYVVHPSFTTLEGRRALPDVVINLPDAKHIVVDAKVSLLAYERYCRLESLEDREAAAREHLASLKKHIRELGAKNYADLYQISSPDFVILFMPVEPALGLAWQSDPDLMLDAFDSNVILVTPSTLMATLRTITNLWRKDKQARNVLEIARQGGLLYDQFVRFYEDLSDLGEYLKKADEAYESVRDRLATGRGNLVKRVENIRKLGAATSKGLPLDLIEKANIDSDEVDDRPDSSRQEPNERADQESHEDDGENRQ